MREVKRGNPSVVCNLQYDKLYVNHRCFVWSDVQGRVVPYTPVTLVYSEIMTNNVSPGGGRARGWGQDHVRL